MADQKIIDALERIADQLESITKLLTTVGCDRDNIDTLMQDLQKESTINNDTKLGICLTYGEAWQILGDWFTYLSARQMKYAVDKLEEHIINQHHSNIYIFDDQMQELKAEVKKYE